MKRPRPNGAASQNEDQRDGVSKAPRLTASPNGQRSKKARKRTPKAKHNHAGNGARPNKPTGSMNSKKGKDVVMEDSAVEEHLPSEEGEILETQDEEEAYKAAESRRLTSKQLKTMQRAMSMGVKYAPQHRLEAQEAAVALLKRYAIGLEDPEKRSIRGPMRSTVKRVLKRYRDKFTMGLHKFENRRGRSKKYIEVAVDRKGKEENGTGVAIGRKLEEENGTSNDETKHQHRSVDEKEIRSQIPREVAIERNGEEKNGTSNDKIKHDQHNRVDGKNLDSENFTEVAVEGNEEKENGISNDKIEHDQYDNVDEQELRSDNSIEVAVEMKGEEENGIEVAVRRDGEEEKWISNNDREDDQHNINEKELESEDDFDFEKEFLAAIGESDDEAIDSDDPENWSEAS